MTFKSVDADPNVKIDDRRRPNAPHRRRRGPRRADRHRPSGDVELIPSLASFKSSKGKVLNVTEKTGQFAAVNPGDAVVTGSHVAAKDPAEKEFRVCDPANAKVVFDPPGVAWS